LQIWIGHIQIGKPVRFSYEIASILPDIVHNFSVHVYLRKQHKDAVFSYFDELPPNFSFKIAKWIGHILKHQIKLWNGIHIARNNSQMIFHFMEFHKNTLKDTNFFYLD